MNKLFFLMFLTIGLQGCSSMPFTKTVDHVELKNFMGPWYVIAGRFTFLETNVHNAIETYTWNTEKKQIDIDFKYNKGSFTGPVTKLPQTGWVHDAMTRSHWIVSPIWPLKFDYLIIDRAEDYNWAVIGVPDQKYLWILSRDYKYDQAKVDMILQRVSKLGYNIKDIVLVPHQY